MLKAGNLHGNMKVYVTYRITSEKLVMLEPRPIFRGKYSTFQLNAHSTCIPVCSIIIPHDEICRKLEDILHNSVKGTE